MADLHAIYQEMGLAGLIPHATRSMSKARAMLAMKIKEGEKLYYLHSPVTNAPFLQVMDKARQVLFFTSEEKAKDEASKLSLSQCMDTIVVEFPGTETVEDMMTSMYNAGADSLYLDRAITFSLSNFITLPRYDGHPNEEFLLRNHKLNGAIHYYMQIVQAQMSNLDAEFFFARALFNSHVLLPVDPAKADVDNVLDALIFFDQGYEVPVVAAFTDWDQLFKANFDPSAIVVPFADLADLVVDGSITVVLNPAGVSLHLKPHYVDYLQNVAQAPSAAHIPLVNSLTSSSGGETEEDWTMEDFVPDFLKN